MASRTVPPPKARQVLYKSILVPAEEFVDFAAFPAELREKVWEQCLPEARIIPIGYSKKLRSTGELFEVSCDILEGNPISKRLFDHNASEIDNPLFYVCKESREVAKRTYSIIHPDFMERPIIFHPRADTILFPSMSILHIALMSSNITTWSTFGIGCIGIDPAGNKSIELLRGRFPRANAMSIHQIASMSHESHQQIVEKIAQATRYLSPHLKGLIIFGKDKEVQERFLRILEGGLNDAKAKVEALRMGKEELGPFQEWLFPQIITAGELVEPSKTLDTSPVPSSTEYEPGRNIPHVPYWRRMQINGGTSGLTTTAPQVNLGVEYQSHGAPKLQECSPRFDRSSSPSSSNNQFVTASPTPSGFVNNNLVTPPPQDQGPPPASLAPPSDSPTGSLDRTYRFPGASPTQVQVPSSPIDNKQNGISPASTDGTISRPITPALASSRQKQTIPEQQVFATPTTPPNNLSLTQSSRKLEEEPNDAFSNSGIECRKLSKEEKVQQEVQKQKQKQEMKREERLQIKKEAEEILKRETELEKRQKEEEKQQKQYEDQLNEEELRDAFLSSQTGRGVNGIHVAPGSVPASALSQEMLQQLLPVIGCAQGRSPPMEQNTFSPNRTATEHPQTPTTAAPRSRPRKNTAYNGRSQGSSPATPQNASSPNHVTSGYMQQTSPSTMQGNYQQPGIASNSPTNGRAPFITLNGFRFSCLPLQVEKIARVMQNQGVEACVFLSKLGHFPDGMNAIPAMELLTPVNTQTSFQSGTPGHSPITAQANFTSDRGPAADSSQDVSQAVSKLSTSSGSESESSSAPTGSFMDRFPTLSMDKLIDMGLHELQNKAVVDSKTPDLKTPRSRRKGSYVGSATPSKRTKMHDDESESPETPTPASKRASRGRRSAGQVMGLATVQARTAALNATINDSPLGLQFQQQSPMNQAMAEFSQHFPQQFPPGLQHYQQPSPMNQNMAQFQQQTPMNQGGSFIPIYQGMSLPTVGQNLAFTQSIQGKFQYSSVPLDPNFLENYASVPLDPRQAQFYVSPAAKVGVFDYNGHTPQGSQTHNSPHADAGAFENYHQVPQGQIDQNIPDYQAPTYAPQQVQVNQQMPNYQAPANAPQQIQIGQDMIIEPETPSPKPGQKVWVDGDPQIVSPGGTIKRRGWTLPASGPWVSLTPPEKEQTKKTSADPAVLNPIQEGAEEDAKDGAGSLFGDDDDGSLFSPGSDDEISE